MHRLFDEDYTYSLSKDLLTGLQVMSVAAEIFFGNVCLFGPPRDSVSELFALPRHSKLMSGIKALI